MHYSLKNNKCLLCDHRLTQTFASSIIEMYRCNNCHSIYECGNKQKIVSIFYFYTIFNDITYKTIYINNKTNYSMSIRIQENNRCIMSIHLKNEDIPPLTPSNFIKKIPIYLTLS